MTIPLLIPVKIRADESLHGLVGRAQSKNHYPSLADTLDDDAFAKDKSHGFILGSIAKGRYRLEDLAIRTHNDVASLEAAKLSLDPPSIGSPSDDYIVTAVWRLCPLCVLEDPYHRRAWSLAWITACPTHGTVLVDRCPSCSSEMRISPKLPVRCPDCGAHVALTRPPMAQTIPYSAALEKALRLHTAGDPGPLAQLQTRLTACIAIAGTDFLRGRHRLSPHNMSVAESASLVERFGPSAMTDESLFEYAMSWVARCRARWPLLERAWTVTLEGVAKQAGINVPPGISRALSSAEAGHIPSLQRSDSGDEALATWAIPFELAAHTLDVSPLVLKRLVRTGLIDAQLVNPSVSKSGALRTVSLDNLHALMSKLTAIALAADEPGASVAQTSVNLCRTEQNIALALAGKVTLYRAEGPGLSGFHVRLAETPHGIDRRKVPPGFATVEQAAAKLKTYRAVIDHLLESGRLHSQSGNGHFRKLILESSLESFDREFVLIGSLARSHGLNSTNLTEKLATVGIYPAIGPKIDGSLVPAFRRQDIRTVNFDALRHLKNYPTRTGRQPSRLSAQAERHGQQ